MPHVHSPFCEWRHGDQAPDGGWSTIPVTARDTPYGVVATRARRRMSKAYAHLELRQFSADDPARARELLALYRSQAADDTATATLGRLGGKSVLPHDPDTIEELVYDGDGSHTSRRFGRGRRGRLLVRPKTAREQWEDELVRAGLAPILDELTTAQRDAIRFVHEDGNTMREAGNRLGIAHKNVITRLQRAYDSIRKATEGPDFVNLSYRQVRNELIRRGSAAGTDARDAQRPTIPSARAANIERGESFRAGYERHDCSPMCHPMQSRVSARCSAVECVPLAFASRRYDPRLANAIRLGYRVPDREVAV